LFSNFLPNLPTPNVCTVCGFKFCDFNEVRWLSLQPRCAGTVLMMLSPLQLPSVHHDPSCDGCAGDAEQNQMRNRSVVGKT